MAGKGHSARKITDSISSTAKRLMHQGIAKKKSSATISQEIEATTGERVNVRTIGRRALEWRKVMERRSEKLEDMRALVAAAKEGDLTASAMIQALATEALLNDSEAFSKQDPLKVQSQNLRAEELQLKREALKLKERELAVNESKLQLMQDREQRAIKAISESKEELTAEERVRQIEEIYGIAPQSRRSQGDLCPNT